MAILEVLPPGSYWIGDPCYAFPDVDILDTVDSVDTKWDELLKATEYFTVSSAELDNGKIKVWADGTAYGDGEYTSSTGDLFPVDSGLLGIIPQETIEYLGEDIEELKKLGLFLTFDKPFTIHFSDGYFVFGDMVIQTGGKKIDYSYYEDEEDWDEDWDE